MPGLEDIKSNFERKLDARQAASETRLQEDLAALRAALLSGAQPLRQQAEAAAAGPNPLAGFDARMRLALARRAAQGLVDFSASSNLSELDSAFARQFNLAKFYPLERLRYPTIYCETLAEFFSPIVEMMNLSPQARRQALDQMVSEATAAARQGGIMGVNLSGKGCYLNGWLLSYPHDIPPRAALDRPDLLRHILAVVVHEKLGHGFLEVYSALGAVKSNLGLALAKIAEQFGVRPADDPAATLRVIQSNLLHMVSQFLEEGWATWVEGYFSEAYLGGGPRPRHSLDAIVDAIRRLPRGMPDVREVQETLLAALGVVFGPREAPLEVLNQAVNILEVLGSYLDVHFSDTIGQPLRYAVGEMIMVQAEANLGAGCVPYAALIAANVTFDPARISMSDLQSLLQSDPRLNPDTRLAAISRLEADAPDDIRGLAKLAAARLSISIPAELR